MRQGSKGTNVLRLAIVVLAMLLAACGANQNAPEATEQPDTTVATAVPQSDEGHADEVHADEGHADEGHSDAEHEHDAAAVATGSIAGLTALPAGQVPNVVATTSIVGDVVRQVAGNAAEVTVLLPLGADPHSFEPAPRDVALMTDADVIFINGFGLEEFLGPTLENAGIDPARIIVLSDGVVTREFAAASSDHGHDDEHSTEDSHEHSGVDPHVWFDPTNVMIWTGNAAAALTALDPANAEVYSANATAYKEQLQQLDAFIQQQISTIPAENRELVTDHRAFGYYADRYGLTQIGTVIPAYSTMAEPSAQELAALRDAIAEYDVPALFVGLTVNPQIAEQLARDSGIKLLSLYTGSLSDSDGPASSYIDLMRFNTEQIVSGLA